MATVLGNFPSIQELLESPPLKTLVERVNPTRVMTSVRSFVDGMRQELQTAVNQRQMPSPGALAEQIAQWIMRQEHTGIRAVVNGTGILLHPELGNPPLADEAALALRDAAGSYSRTASREAAGRGSHSEELVQKLTGAEAAIVTSNPSAALALIAQVLGLGREVLIPRSQLAAAADGSRAFELIAAAGCRVRECGATNQLTADDLNREFTSDAAFLFWQQTLSYELMGNHEQFDLAGAAAWANKRSLPLIVDLGYGGLEDGTALGLAKQPTVAEALQAGASAVIVQGAGLLGGPSCGLIVGRTAVVSRLAGHPLFRGVAADKLTLAALEATLQLYAVDNEAAAVSPTRLIPVLGLISTSLDNLKHRCERLAPQLSASPALAEVEAMPGEAFVTSAKLRRERMESWGLALRSAQGTAVELIAALASGTPAVMARQIGDRVWIDLRTVSPREDQQIVLAIEQLGRNHRERSATEEVGGK
jgi:L-seryl-tRNA(Ser) seleniumtransferase